MTNQDFQTPRQRELGLGLSCDSAPADLELVRNARAGLPGSTEALLQRLRCLARFLAAINVRSGSPLDSHELSDVVQDCLLVVWRKLDQFQGPSGLDSWVLRIARFEYQNARRKKARNSQGVVAFTEAAELPAPEDAVERFAQREAMALALEELQPEAAEVVRLRHYQGLSFDEIGERMQCSANTAKTRYYRSLTRLAETMESQRS